MDGGMMIQLGQRAVRQREISAELIAAFVELSGDRNPIHTNPEAARHSRYGRIVAPGLLTAAFISAIIANDMPGPGTIYVSQDLKFTAPIFVGDRIEVSVEVTSIDQTRGRATLATEVVAPHGSALIGEAVVLLPSN